MGKVICAGLGPGDPDLISVRADRAIRGARQIAYFRKKGRAGQARRIVSDMLAAGVTEHAMEYPVSRVLCDARILNIFEGAGERLLGRMVVIELAHAEHRAVHADHTPCVRIPFGCVVRRRQSDIERPSRLGRGGNDIEHVWEQ